MLWAGSGLIHWWDWVVRLVAKAFNFAFFFCAASAIIPGFAFFPDAERWWSIDVWWPEASGETSREGMGMMVVAAAMAAAALIGLRRA